VTLSVYVVAGFRASVACHPPEPSTRPCRRCPSEVVNCAVFTVPFATVTTTGVSGRTERDPSAGAKDTAVAGDEAVAPEVVAATEVLPAERSSAPDDEHPASPTVTATATTTARTRACTTDLPHTSADDPDRCRPREDARTRRGVARAHDSEGAARTS
jgi:hypothetical protein